MDDDRDEVHIELDIGLFFLLQAAPPQLVTDRETKTHRRGRSKRSYGHCRRRTEVPEAERGVNSGNGFGNASSWDRPASPKTSPLKILVELRACRAVWRTPARVGKQGTLRGCD